MLANGTDNSKVPVFKCAEKTLQFTAGLSYNSVWWQLNFFFWPQQKLFKTITYLTAMHQVYDVKLHPGFPRV